MGGRRGVGGGRGREGEGGRVELQPVDQVRGGGMCWPEAGQGTEGLFLSWFI